MQKSKQVFCLHSNRRQFLKLTGQALAVSAIPFCSAAQEGLSGRWQTLPSLPFPVQEIYPTLLNGKIHVAGGFAVTSDAVTGKLNRGPTNRHIQYDIEQQKWMARASMPEARHHPNLVACNNAVYALGGYQAADNVGTWVMQNQTWLYTQEDDQWQRQKAAPELHGETVCLTFKNQIHVIGGRQPRTEKNADWGDHQDSQRHLVFEPASQQWHSAAPALIARNSAAGAVIDKLLYVVGGRTVGGGNVSDLEIYDAKEDKWRKAAPMPQAQGGLAAASLDGRLMAFGGEYFGASGRGVYKEAWRYLPEKDQWSAIRPMLSPRHGLGAVSDGNSIYAIAGATEAGGNGTSALMERLIF